MHKIYAEESRVDVFFAKILRRVVGGYAHKKSRLEAAFYNSMA